MPRKYSKRAQINRMRRLVSEIVHLRDKVCQRCGKKDGKLDCSHIMPKGRHPSMQFELSNVKLLCFQCHRWWHEHPLLAADWALKYFGSDRINLLKSACNQTRLLTRQFLDSAEEELLETLEEMK